MASASAHWSSSRILFATAPAGTPTASILKNLAYLSELLLVTTPAAGCCAAGGGAGAGGGNDGAGGGATDGGGGGGGGGGGWAPELGSWRWATSEPITATATQAGTQHHILA